MKKTLLTQDDTDLQDNSAVIIKKLTKIIKEQEFDVILAYQAFFKGEIALPIDNWQICFLPFCDSEGNMKFYKYEQNLQNQDIPSETYQSIIKSQNSNELYEPNRYKKPLILTPGLAFDSNNNRLGRGQGFYDRWLASHTNIYSIGVCHDFQILNHIPVEPHDKALDMIVTEV